MHSLLVLIPRSATGKSVATCVASTNGKGEKHRDFCRSHNGKVETRNSGFVGRAQARRERSGESRLASLPQT